MTRVLALDPGERVGWARADVADDGSWTDLRHGITPLKDMALAVYEHTAKWIDVDKGNGYDAMPDYDVLVVEDWRLRAEKARSFIGSSFPAVQFIGMVRLCAWLSGCQMVMQGPNTIHSREGDAPCIRIMKRLSPELYEFTGQSISHDDGHDLDAIRHLYVWTVQHTDLVKTRLNAVS